jgi:recombinational DNA repair protein (RecF pathway)
MQEQGTLALVLSVEQVGEYDARVILYTEQSGKVHARARSLFKMKGKLAGHLQPLTIARVRLVEKKGVQIVDAMSEYRYIHEQTPTARALELLGMARLLTELTHPGQPDESLWQLISSRELVGKKLLVAIGFDPEHARCSRCERSAPSHFLLREEQYICKDCLGLWAQSGIRTGDAVVY